MEVFWEVINLFILDNLNVIINGLHKKKSFGFKWVD